MAPIVDIVKADYDGDDVIIQVVLKSLESLKELADKLELPIYHQSAEDADDNGNNEGYYVISTLCEKLCVYAYMVPEKEDKGD